MTFPLRPAPPRETPEQIVARGGRPIDFSVSFPSGVGPEEEEGGVWMGGELRQWTPEDRRNYQNKLSEMLGLREPDGSPKHSDESAKRIAADWMYQQKRF